MRLTDRNQLLPGYPGYEMAAKLCDLEDIEDEKGVSLKILDAALKKGIYVKIKGVVHYISPNHVCYYFNYLSVTEWDMPLYLAPQDYKITWSLIAEDL